MVGTWKKIKEGNWELLSSMGGVQKPKDFARIRSFGDKNTATTWDGLKVERQESLFVEGFGMVRVLPTTMHFIFEDKSKKLGRWAFMCTCGSLGGIVSYKELGDLVSPELGEYVLVCVNGLAYKQNVGIFKHSDGSSE